MDQIRLWPANTLPVPFLAEFEEEKGPAASSVVVVDDNFPKGEVLKYFPNQGYGFVKDRVGREVYFNLSEMGFVGFKGRDEIKEGQVVGYDLSHSGRGLHIKKMKIY